MPPDVARQGYVSLVQQIDPTHGAASPLATGHSATPAPPAPVPSFAAAPAHAATTACAHASTGEKLQLYGLFKQASRGDAPRGARPGVFDPVRPGRSPLLPFGHSAGTVENHETRIGERDRGGGGVIWCYHRAWWPARALTVGELPVSLATLPPSCPPRPRPSPRRRAPSTMRGPPCRGSRPRRLAPSTPPSSPRWRPLSPTRFCCCRRRRRCRRPNK